jgi:hypothetical protein
VCAWDCENVVVIMTSETLKRMWCAAEIASAHAGEGKVAPWDLSDLWCEFSLGFGQQEWDSSWDFLLN